MSQQNPQLQKFVTDVNAQLARANESITNINADIVEHNKQNEELKAKNAILQKALDDINTSPSVLSPEDQASLDTALEAVKAQADALAATDQLTPLPEVIPLVAPI